MYKICILKATQVTVSLFLCRTFANFIKSIAFNAVKIKTQ